MKDCITCSVKKELYKYRNAGYSIFVRVKSETNLGNFLSSVVIDYAALLSVLFHNKS
jgi:hypothetical protein